MKSVLFCIVSLAGCVPLPSYVAPVPVEPVAYVPALPPVEDQAAKQTRLRHYAELHPSPALTKAMADTKYLTLANAYSERARGCGLRSGQWRQVIFQGSSQAANQIIIAAHLNEGEQLAIENAGLLLFSKAMASQTCISLAHSPLMGELDQMEDAIIGDYR